MKLSVAMATFNEERNIEACLNSIRGWADEIILVDGGSKDETTKIAQRCGAKVTITDNPLIFHINKQKAVDFQQTIGFSSWMPMKASRSNSKKK